MDASGGKRRKARKAAESADRQPVPTTLKRAYGGLLAEAIDTLRRLDGKPWSNGRFAGDIGVDDRTVRNWRNGITLPDRLTQAGVEQRLFRDMEEHAAQRTALHEAWVAADLERRRSGQDTPTTPPVPTIPNPDRCLGRDADIDSLVAALLVPGGTTVLVLGEGGMGKTTLTRAAANHVEVLARFGTRRHEAELAATLSAAAMQDAIAAALGADPKQGMEGIRVRLAVAPALLLLDNLETPWEAEPQAVEALLAELASVPGLALLSSLRGAESPRRPRWAHRCDLHPLDVETARTLFRDIAHRIRPDDPDLPTLLTELGGLPLAIELVARQAEPDATLSRVHAAWRRLGPSLADARAAPDHRHASLARSIELSLDSPRLRDPGRRLFRLLGALPAGLAAADEEPLLGADAFDAAKQLCSVALAHQRHGRLDLLPPVRRYAAEEHPPHGTEQGNWVRHYLALAREHGTRIGREGGATAAARLQPELPNCDAAMAAADGIGLLAEAMAAVEGYGRCGSLLRLDGNGLRALAPACRVAGERRAEADCLMWLGSITAARLDYTAARQNWDEALLLYCESGDRLGKARCTKRLAELAFAEFDECSAERDFNAALLFYDEAGDTLGKADCLMGLADIALCRSDHAAALQRFADALLIYRNGDDPLGVAGCLVGFAQVALLCSGRSRSVAARQGYKAAISIYRAVGADEAAATHLATLGILSAAEGNTREARRLIDRAINLLESVGSAGRAAWAKGLLRELGL